MFIQDAFDEAQKYLVTRDRTALESAIQGLEEELHNPMLQETTVKLAQQYTVEVVGKLVQTKNSLKILAGDFLASGEIIEDRLIRVVASDQPESSVLILLVVSSSDTCLILAPVADL